ncbi:MAG: hypothetical protein ABIO63_10365, partial [Casimicrobiaceae bacterium]
MKDVVAGRRRRSEDCEDAGFPRPESKPVNEKEAARGRAAPFPSDRNWTVAILCRGVRSSISQDAPRQAMTATEGFGLDR